MGRRRRRICSQLGRAHPYQRKAPRYRVQHPFRNNSICEEYVNLFDPTCLISLHKKESAEIVIVLDAHLEDLKRTLNYCRVEEDMTVSMLIVKIIERAFCCDSMPNSLQRIYDAFLNEEFIQFVIFEFMTSSNRAEIQESIIQEYTERLITMCKRCVELFPGCLSTVFGFYDLLLLLVSSFHSESDFWSELDTSGIYKAFTELTESKCLLLQNWIRPDFLEKQNCNKECADPVNFRKINIIPKASRSYILADKSQFLQKNKKTGTYDDLEQYLDIQFRLLREDFMTPLREGLKQYLDTTSSTERQHRNPYIRVYKCVYIRAPTCKRDLTFTVEFDPSKLKKVNWKHSKRLIHGALICLSSDNFKTLIYGTIAERDPASLKKGKTRVKFENGIKNIRMLDDTRYTMIDTNTLFEAYRHVLLALQRTKNIPFGECILKCQSEIHPPRYLRHERYNQFDLSPLVNKRDNEHVAGDNKLGVHTEHGHRPSQCKYEDRVNYEKVDMLDLNDWPQHETLQLDDSQFGALQTALTKEFSIIQGPPGTGKTYIGLQIVRLLLENRKAWSFRILEYSHESNKRNTQSLHDMSDELDSFAQDIRENISGNLAVGIETVNSPRSSIEDDSLQYMRSELVSNDIVSDGEEKQLGFRFGSDGLISIHSEETQNEFVEDLRPILIVCYTNHALDQFLEGITEFYDGDIIRVGGRSKSKTLEKYNLSNIRNVVSVSNLLTRNIKDINRNIYKQKRTVALLALELECLNENIMHIGCLTNGSPIVNDQLCKNYHYRSKDCEEYCFAEGYTKLLGNSPTVIWLRLFEKLAEIVSLRKRTVSTNNARSKEGKPQNPKKCCLYDMSNESDSFIQDVREEIDEKIAVDMHIIKDSRKSTEKEFLDYLRVQLMSTDIMSDEEEEYIANNINALSTNDRWRLYRKWTKNRCSEIVEETKAKLVNLEKACLKRAELDMQKDKQVMQNASIIGMTTTCAARYHTILNEVKPRIIIIEEAAEVFESHVIASLNPACDQMILIGDHKQLRPAPATYGLARRYNLDVSLFERMVTNGIHCDSLKMQHRMRPSIAKLVRKIYPNLLDHKSVQRYRNIKGISQNLFFVSHEYDEFYDKDQKTYSNQHEAMFAIALLKYISQQGYKPCKITLLTTYKGQLFLLKNLLKEEDADNRDLVVTVVDNYQGEENDIVVLSLVRSNKDGDIGFVKQANRICVSLSRAKKGLYIIGNARKLAEASLLWRGIVTDLDREQLIGEGLLLYCQNHPEKKIFAITYDDFKQAPEGGCQETCDIRLCCGHVCERKCHILDSCHDNVICQKRCIKKCKNGHQCSKRCNEVCGKCNEMIIETLKCGHIKPIACHIGMEQYICDEVCNKKLQCGHTCKKKCGKDCFPCHVPSRVSLLKCKHVVELKCCQSYIPECQKKCDKKLQCGHSCTEICGNATTNFQQKENEAMCELGHTIVCNERCDSKLVCKHKCKGKCADCFGKRLHYPCSKRCNCDLVCGHPCEGLCEDCFPCERRCGVSCSHRRCQRACKDQCQKCQEPCMWECPHFKCTALCGEMCNRQRCYKPCLKILKCGHMCIGLCGERCPTKCLICNKKFLKSKGILKSESQSIRVVELEECNHLIEYKAMDAYMDEQEIPVRFKRCPECTQPIRRSLRYNNVVKRIQLKAEELKIAAVPALKLQNDLLNNIESSNFQRVKSVIEAVDNYLNSEATFGSSEKPSLLHTIILSKNYAEFGTPRRHLISHQTILDVSLEIRRYFDKKVLELLKSNLISSVEGIQSDLKSCIKMASRILDLKCQYDQEDQKVVENCITQLRNVLPSVHPVALNIDIIPVTDVATIEGYSQVACREKSEETKQILFHLHLFIQKRPAYYQCGTSRMAPSLRQTEARTSQDQNPNLDKRNTSSLGSSKTGEGHSKENKIQPDSFGKRRHSEEDRFAGSSSKKRKTNKKERNYDADHDAIEEGQTSTKLNKRSSEQMITQVKLKKRKEKPDETEVATRKQNSVNHVNCRQENVDLCLIESMLKEHINDTDVKVEVIDDINAERTNKQSMKIGDPLPDIAIQDVTEDQPEKMKQTPDLRQTLNALHSIGKATMSTALPPNKDGDNRYVTCKSVTIDVPDCKNSLALADTSWISAIDLRHKLDTKSKFSSKENSNSETIHLNDIFTQTKNSALNLRAKLKSETRACPSGINKRYLTNATGVRNINCEETKDAFDISCESRNKSSAMHGDQRIVKDINDTSKQKSAASKQGDNQLVTRSTSKDEHVRSLVGYDDLL